MYAEVPLTFFSINPCVLENPSLQYAFTLKVIFEGIGLGQFFRSFQKQSPGGVLWKSCSEKYAKLTGNYLLWILCLGSYIPGHATLIKSTLKQVLSCGFRKNYEKSYPAERKYSTYSKILWHKVFEHHTVALWYAHVRRYKGVLVC